MAAKDKSSYKDDLGFLRPAMTPLDIIVIGAGIGGLTAAIGLHRTGHNITVLESASHITEVGAGIQMAPNSSRIFSRFGLFEHLLAHTNITNKISIRRYANNEELSSVHLDLAEAREKYHSPLGVIHRGDLQGTILREAQRLGIKILTGHRVVEVDQDSIKPRVRTRDGIWMQADLVLAADGVKSMVRHQMAAKHGAEDRILVTGDSAYRVLIPREKLVHDSEALALINDNTSIRWIGPGGHIMGYPVKPRLVDGREQSYLYNMVLLHPSPNPGAESEQETWTNKGSKTEMMAFYGSWAPIIRKLLSYAPEEEVLEWTLNMHEPLLTWVEGNVALLGDASHPMLPYVAQGMANAVEDAGVLTEIFSHTDNIQLGLEVYQIVRKERAEKIQNSTLQTRQVIHLPDGPEQVSRDEAMRAAMHGGAANPDFASDNTWQEFMWATDVMKIVRENWDDLVEQCYKDEQHK